MSIKTQARAFVCLVIVAILDVCPVDAQETAGEFVADNSLFAAIDAEDADNRRLYKLLETPLTLEFDGIFWHEAVDRVAQQLNISIEIPDEILRSESHWPNELQHATYAGTSASRILRDIFERQDIHCFVCDGRLRIGEGDDVPMIRRVYDVSRFLERGWVLDIPAHWKPSSESESADEGFVLQPAPGECLRTPTLDEMIIYLTDAPWQRQDQYGGHMHAVGGRLVIFNRLHVHNQIRHFFGVLDEMAAGQHCKSSVALFVEPGDAIVHRAMGKRVTIDLHDVRLGVVANALKQSAGIPIRVSESSFDDDELTYLLRDPVSLSVKDVTLHQALETLYEDYYVDYSVFRGQCAIHSATTRCWANFPVLHDVSDFDPETREGLVDLLRKCSDGPWICVEEIGGWVALVPGDVLIVSQTAPVQRDVHRLLRDLRQPIE